MRHRHAQQHVVGARVPVIVDADDDGDDGAGDQLALGPRVQRDAQHGRARALRHLVAQDRLRSEADRRRHRGRGLAREAELLAAAVEQLRVGVAVEQRVDVDVAAAHRARNAASQGKRRRQAGTAGSSGFAGSAAFGG